MAFLLHQLLQESTRRHPDRPAVTFGERTLTYRELDLATDGFAALLLDLGVTKGTTVGIHLRRSVDALIAMIGALKAGAVYVPLDRQSPRGRLRFIVDTCRIAVVATGHDDLAALDDALDGTSSVRHVVVMDGTGPEPRSTGVALVDWTATARVAAGSVPAPTIDNDAAYVLFTSGSTGVPKGVAISHRNVLTFVDAASDLFAITEHDRLSHVCPLHSDMSVIDIYIALKAGACIVGIPETNAMFPVKVAQAIGEGRITVWNSVPSALVGLASLADLERHDLSSLRLVLFAGEVFPPQALRRIMAAAPAARFCNMYGQTEANSSTYHWVDAIPEGSNDPIPIGRALPNFEVFALDDEGHRVVAPRGEGELYVRSSTVALGYWEDPARTSQAFVADPLAPDRGERVYRTGDIVRLDASGAFVFVGRRDQMIKSRGYRIEIGEIEAALRHNPGIRSAAVIAVPDERIGNRLAAFIEPTVPGSLTRDEIVAYCVEELPRYMVPEEITFLDALPMTPSGKVDRQRLARS
jgi:amino acid adenylation domain-containing protein